MIVLFFSKECPKVPFELYSIFKFVSRVLKTLDHYNLKAVFLKKILFFRPPREKREINSRGEKGNNEFLNNDKIISSIPSDANDEDDGGKLIKCYWALCSIARIIHIKNVNQTHYNMQVCFSLIKYILFFLSCHK